MKIHEECGVFGVMTKGPADVAMLSYLGLYALQHRGQESCGIVVNEDGIFHSHKDLGLVSEVFTRDVLSRLPKGNIAVAHTRYGTTGATSRRNCQPIEVNHQKGHMAIAHNGNLSNAAELRSELELSGAIFHTTSDTETIAYIITRERLRAPSIEEAVSRAMNSLEGAYSLVIMSPQKLICARDPYGFRPLCYGRMEDGSYVIASESCALTAVGAQLVRDVEPGEILVFTSENVISRREHCGSRQGRFCIFEYIYFARPDSVIDGAAIGYSQASGIPYGIGLIKNKYIGRTFIAPDARADQVRIKLAPIRETVEGKIVILIDDSIVRGTTCGRIVRLLRDAGAKEVHMRVTAPPFLHPCYYGTDIDSRESLIACHHSVPGICRIIGADSLGYLPVDKLQFLAGHENYCSACFSGKYPTPVPQGNCKRKFEQRLAR